jgi:hypothetical protein
MVVSSAVIVSAALCTSMPWRRDEFLHRQAMATERLPMRHIREILRLKWRLHRSHHETALSLGLAPALRE